jgi:hypothetical protein
VSRLKRLLIAYNAWQQRDCAALDIAAAIEAASPPCDAPVHPPGCLPCTLARQARRDAAIARETGAAL